MFSREAVPVRLLRRMVVTMILVIAGVAASDAANTDAPSLVMKFEQNAVVISSATPGGRVIVLGLSISNGLAPAQRSERVVVTDDDRDGVVRFSPKYPIPTRSVWIAVDFESGSYVVAGVPGYTPNVVPFPDAKLKHGSTGDISSIEEERQELTVTIVRPGEGAWSSTARQGGPLDDDGPSDGKLKFSFSSASPFVGNDVLKHLKNGDVLVGIDARQMQFYAGRIGK